MKKSIYLDHAATTPLDPAVFDAMRPYFTEQFGNPGSLHSFGQKASAAVFAARQTIASELGCHYSEIIFTGGATEANNLALRGAIKQWRSLQAAVSQDLVPRIIVSSIEHESVLETARDLEKEGVEVVYLPVSQEGVVDVQKLKAALTERTVLVSVMYANNEVGTIQPIAEIAQIITDYKLSIANSSAPVAFKNLLPAIYPLFHTDAVQAFQYLSCNVQALGVDLLTLSAHKIYGPKGVGCLYVRQSLTPRLKATSSKLQPLLTGGGQEQGLRSGTENVPAIVGFAKAVEIAMRMREKESRRVAVVRDDLLKRIKIIWKSVVVNGRKDGRLPNNLNLYIPHAKGSPALSGEQLLIALDVAGVAVSSGSACAARSIDPSHVLTAMGFDRLRSKNSLRFTLGRQTTKKEIQTVVSVLESLKKKKA